MTACKEFCCAEGNETSKNWRKAYIIYGETCNDLAQKCMLPHTMRIMVKT
jgi:hypothetical protein